LTIIKLDKHHNTNTNIRKQIFANNVLLKINLTMNIFVFTSNVLM